MAFRELERVETRALGALRFVGAATGVMITTPMRLSVENDAARFLRNRGGVYVISSWAPLAAHEQAFAEPPDEPATGSIDMTVDVSDPSGRYLPRRVTVRMPRDPDPAAGGAESLFRPVDVPMYPAPRAATGTNWSVLRVSVSDGSSGDALGGVLLRVRRNGELLARALTDGRGEGLVPLAGIPLVTFGEDDDAVVVDAVNVTLHAVFDPDQGTRMTAAALGAGARAPAPVVDPNALEADADTLPSETLALSVAARRSQRVAITLDLP